MTTMERSPASCSSSTVPPPTRWKALIAILLLVTLALVIAILGIRQTRVPVAAADSSQNQSALFPTTSSPATIAPTMDPSMAPTLSPTRIPTLHPTTTIPTLRPTREPSRVPSISPSTRPSSQPSLRPTLVPETYYPGKLTVVENNLLLSEGLTSRVIAQTGRRVLYHSGRRSVNLFHPLPDFGATFPDPQGGWVYVSNSEVKDLNKHPQKGGVGSITFDRNGNVVDYGMILNNTLANCGGGKTPWGTWISCEEYKNGKIWQVDPFGRREPETITLGQDGGYFESFAYDIDDEHYFVTEDAEAGPLRRFSTRGSYPTDPWNTLHGPGVTEYLLLNPNPNDDTVGTYSWTLDKALADENSKLYYQHSEGIDVWQAELYFVCKNSKTMFTLNLRDGSYVRQSTEGGLFDGHPDQLQRVIGHGSATNADLLYFTEEGGSNPGVHARDSGGNYFTILESPIYNDETSGLAFSPDGKHMYFAYQETGILFDVTRLDGLPFNARTLNVKYHHAAE